MRVAAKTGLTMGTGSFDAAVAANDAYTTPSGFAPKMGALAYLIYKEAEARILVNTDAEGVVRVMANGVELGRLNFSGVTAGRVALDLADVQGQTGLKFVVDVNVVGTGNGTVEGAIDIDQPAVALTSC
ncbi:hypothetical protein EHM94_05775 [Marinobacter sp. NP-6]|uniref:hypothetical protein n=1 Tax=Marinobacter sp. NP-6 TaxID=2488666 RepID=UPI000FCB76D9|nr:hypothetical protein [Marinobacter sp. NP-6]RUT74702.1 hypothetical protein EHM94_05775 [Marinobacter sp. NP-6]